MAAFPALMPLRRAWEFSKFPTLDYESITGNTISFEFGATPSDQPLTLIYELISEAEMQQLRDHYLEQQSVHPFTLSPVVMAGYANPVIDPNTQWLYDGEPEAELVAFDLYNCEVALRSVRP